MSKHLAAVAGAVILILLLAYAVFRNEAVAPADSRVQKNEATRAGKSVQPVQPDMIRFGDATLSIEIADTADERIRGLSGRPSLPEGTGLLFIFDTQGLHGIWMKDMSFPIDMARSEPPRRAHRRSDGSGIVSDRIQADPGLALRA